MFPRTLAAAILLLVLPACELEAGIPDAPPVPSLVGTSPDLVGTDQDGHRFRLAKLSGTPTVVLFGYSLSQEAGPSRVARVAAALAALEEEGSPADAVFVTVDPQRDTVLHLGEWIPAFHHRFSALRATGMELALACETFGFRPTRHRLDGDSDNGPERYTVDYRDTIFVLDSDGVVRHRLRGDASAAAIAGALRMPGTES